MNYQEESLKLHENKKGKFEIKSKVSINNKEDLSLAYTPGVASPCLKIKDNKDDVYKYTSKGNMIAIVSDGSAVLGLGNIGPEAAIPVMEGKAILFKEFANVDAIPICLDTQDSDEIIKTIINIAPSFGGINLEDISAPRCVYIERKLKELLNIPVFHDDQHGTAIVIGAALINACRLTKRSLSSLKVVLSGTGAAGSSIARHLKKLGVKSIYAYNALGVVDFNKYDTYDFLIKELLDEKIIDVKENHNNTLASLLEGSDCFIGVSAPNIVSKEMIKSMNKDPFVFPLANPNPEISYEDAKTAGAYIVGTGRSDYPNQVNNLLAFPGIFRGALDARVNDITDEMKIAASYAIANVIKEEELNIDYIIPSPFNNEVVKKVANSIKKLMIRKKLQSMIGQKVNVYIDRPIGSVHPNQNEIVYQVNYGYIKEIIAADNEYQDAYVLGIDEPIEECTGYVYAVVERENDIEDKLIIVVDNKDYTIEEIKEKINFQEKYFKYKIV